MLGLDFPCVMGVLNVTPDSFSDGGKFQARDSALRQALHMIEQGAAIVDVGGESTRPGAGEVPVQQEIDRIVPVIEAICAESDIPVSVDSSKAAVMRAAIDAGAAMINDVCALRSETALQTAVQLQKPVCLMHMQGEPRTMQKAPTYNDVVAEVTQYLRQRVAECVAAGLPRELLVVDPGFGFGKTVEQNIELLGNLRHLQLIGCPVLIGVSRKSTLGAITDREVNDRLAASLAAATVAVMQGAAIVRAHDVRETVDAVRVAWRLMEADRER